MDEGAHVPVLLDEAVAALAIQPTGTYVDATFGRGGHAARILAALAPTGRLLAVDRDPDAARVAEALVRRDSRFTFHRAWFSELPAILAEFAPAGVDGALFDLGTSSPQIDDAARGFSFRFDGPLDMRMDPSRGESAAAFLARATVRELTEVIRDYGEERFAQSIAKAIAAAREERRIERTGELRRIVGEAVGPITRGDWRQDPATRTFQALRIFLNRELSEISGALPSLVPRLRPHGRLAVIAFHSLEDRIVKRFFQKAAQPFAGDPATARLPLRADALPVPPLALVGRATKPTAHEVERNPRARSAILRVAERTTAAMPADWPRGYLGALPS